MRPPSGLPPRAWLVVGLLWFVGGCNYLVRIMITTMHGSVVEAFPMSEAHFGLLSSSFLWVYGLLSPFAGYLSDRFSRSRVILVSMIGWSTVTWLTAYARNFEELIAMRALLGVFEACYLPAALALITDYHRGPTRAFAVGVHMTGIMVGSALGGLGGWLAEHRSWHYAFSLVGGAGVVYGVLLIFVLRDHPREAAGGGHEPPGHPRFFPAIRSLFGNGSFILALVYWGLLGIVPWAMSGWMPVYLKEHFNLAQGVAGFSSTGFSYFPGIAGLLIGGAWSDRWSRSNPRACLYVPAIGLALSAPGILLAAHTGTLGFALAGLVVFGATTAFTSSTMMPILCLVSSPRYRATGYGVLNAVANVVAGLTNYAGGALRDAHIDIVRIFELAAAAEIVCAALVLFLRPRAAT